LSEPVFHFEFETGGSFANGVQFGDFALLLKFRELVNGVAPSGLEMKK
jgi:hypothetical protein